MRIYIIWYVTIHKNPSLVWWKEGLGFKYCLHISIDSTKKRQIEVAISHHFVCYPSYRNDASQSRYFRIDLFQIKCLKNRNSLCHIQFSPFTWGGIHKPCGHGRGEGGQKCPKICPRGLWTTPYLIFFQNTWLQFDTKKGGSIFYIHFWLNFRW